MRIRAFIIVSTLIILVSATAMGNAKKFKCPAVPKQEAVAIKKAGRYFSVGEKMALRGAYKKSLERYLCSLKMKAHPNTMFNIAQVAKLIEKKKPAVQLLKKFRSRNPEHPAIREINDLINKMETGDYEAINTEPTEPETTTEPAPPEPPEPVVEQTPIAPATPSPDVALLDKSKKQKIAGIVLISAGTIFTVMGTGMAIGSSQAKTDGLNTTSYDDFVYFDDRHRALGTGAVISYLLGAACLTSGVIFLVKSKKLKAKASRPAAMIFSPVGVTFSF